MKKLLSKKLLVSITAVSLVFGVSSASFAASTLKKITAYQNAAIKVEVDGSSIDLSSSNGMLYPIVYNGNSYVPAKAVAEALGATVKWNGSRQAVEITSGETSSNAGIPYNDNTSGSNSAPSTPSTPSTSITPSTPSSSGSVGKATTNGKTIDNAIPFGQSVTYDDSYTRSSDGYKDSKTYTVSVSSVKSISTSEIEELGFKKPSSDSKVEYKLVRLKVSVNAKVLSTKSAVYLSTLEPNIWGSKAPSGKYVIGGTNYGFDSSLDKAISKAVEFKKLSSGDSGSYSVEGDIILPVVKGETNYLALRLDDTSDYDNSFVYFALE